MKGVSEKLALMRAPCQFDPLSGASSSRAGVGTAVSIGGEQLGPGE